MSVSYYGYSQSHNSASYSASESSFQWASGGASTNKGVLVFVFSISATAQDTGVTYGGQAMQLVSGGEANDTATEPGTVRTYFLGSNIPAGSQTIIVSRVNNATQMWADCVLFDATTDTEPYGALIQEENGTFAARSVDDGSPGSNSLRAAAGYSGGNSILTAATGSTVRGSNDLGSYTCTVAVENTAGQGARNVGFTYATSDDRAYVAIAIREYVPPPSSPPILVQFEETTWTGAGAKSTPSISWETGDLIVVIAGTEGTASTVAAPTATGLSFNADTSVGSGSQCWANSWSAVAASSGTSAVSSSGAGSTYFWGMSVRVYRNSYGKRARATAAQVSPKLNLTRTQDYSAVDYESFDYTTTSPMVNTFVPSGSTVRENSSNDPRYSVYAADWGDQGSSGTTLYGPDGSASTGPFTIIVIEILGGPAASGSDLSGEVQLKKMSVSGTGSGISITTASPSLKKMIVDGTGGPPEIGEISGGPSLKKMSVSGTGSGVSVVSNGPILKKMSVSGSGTKVTTVSGGPSLKKMSSSGSGSGISSAVGESSLKKMSSEGSGTGISSAVGESSLKKMSSEGSGTAVTFISGDSSLKKMVIEGSGGTSVSFLRENTCECGPGQNPGDPVSTTNTQGPNQFSNVYNVTFDNAWSHRGATSLRIQYPSGTSLQVTVDWADLNSAFTKRFYRLYGKIPSAPPNQARIWSSNYGGTTAGPSIRLQTDRTVSVFNGPGSQLQRSTGTIPIGVSFRLEFDMTNCTESSQYGDWRFACYSGSNLETNTPDWEMSGTNAILFTAATHPNRIFAGGTATMTGDWYWNVDDFAIDDTIQPGPTQFEGEESDLSGDVGLRKMSIDGSGSGITSASGGLSLKKMSAEGSGSPVSSAAGDLPLKKMSVAGTSAGISEATGDPVLKKMVPDIIASAFFSDIGDFSGGPSLKKMGVAGSGSGISAASGDSSLVKMEPSGAGSPVSNASGAPSLKKMIVSIEGSAFFSEIASFSGGPSLKKIGVSGTGASISAISGGPSLKKIIVVSSGTGISEISGSPDIKKMIAEGEGAGISNGLVSISIRKMGVHAESVVKIQASDMYIFSLL